MTRLRLLTILFFALLMSACDSITDSGTELNPTDNNVTPQTTPPVLKTPENNSNNITSEVNLEWNTVDGIGTYQIQLSKTENFDDISSDRKVTSNRYEGIGKQI